MDLQELISRLAVALGIGLLIGLERGWRRRGATPGSRAAGIRTFALSGLLGGVIAALAQALPKQESGGVASLAIVLGVAFAAYSAVIALFARDENQAAGNFSATTAIAGMLTFALGAYALLGDMRIAAGAAVAATALLAAREELHGWVEQITWPELRSAVVLLAMTFIGLPILPDAPLGPFGGVNPREVWLIAIVLASVSFLGYAAVKYFGARRGLLLAAAGSRRGGCVGGHVFARRRHRGCAQARTPRAGRTRAHRGRADGGGVCHRLDDLAESRSRCISQREVSQSVRSPVGCGICRFPGCDHRARSCARGGVRCDGCGDGRDRRRARRCRCGHRRDRAAHPRYSEPSACGVCHSRRCRQRYGEQDCHRRGHRPRLVRGRSCGHGIGLPRGGGRSGVVDVCFFRAVNALRFG